MSFTEESLDLVGYQGESVANMFFRQKHATDRLAIILPGAGYSVRMPLLYYTVSLFLESGADILGLEYDYRSTALRQAADFQQKLIENILAAAAVGLQQRQYQHVTLIGKSLGTRAMSWILSDKNHPFVGLPDFRTVWLTPVWSDEQIFSMMKDWKGRALHVIGTGDHAYYSEDRHQRMMQSGNTSVVAIPGADHSLDIDGDINASLAAIRVAIEAVRDFVFEK